MDERKITPGESNGVKQQEGNVILDLEMLAARIAGCLGINPGDYVLIRGGIHQFDLLSKVSLQVAFAGGIPSLFVVNDEMVRRTRLETPEEFLRRPLSTRDRQLAMFYDAALEVDPLTDEELLADLPSERAVLGIQRAKDFDDLVKARRRRTIFMAWPTAKKAISCGLTESEFESLFFEALAADVELMTKRGKKIREILLRGGPGSLRTVKGTDLTFRLDTTRRVMVDTGCFDPEQVRLGDITKNLPCGEVYTTLVEDSVEGVAVFDLVIIDGRPVVDLCLEFTAGRLMQVSAREGIELFHSTYDHARGDRDRIGELGIGINPALRKPIGHTLLDEKIFGSIHLALGENRMYGGLNNASIHWDLVMPGATLTVGGGTAILNGGNFNHEVEPRDG